MRLLFLSNVFPNPVQPHKGTFNKAMLAAIAQSHSVRAISPVSWFEEAKARFRSGPRIDRNKAAHVAGVWTEYPRFYYSPKVLRSFYDRFMWWSVRSELLAAADSFSPDAILSYWAHPDGAVANRLAKKIGVPSVVMVGGTDVLLLANSGRRRTEILSALHDADAVVAVSRHIANHLQQAGVSADKIHVVYRGVDRDTFCPGDKTIARDSLGIDRDRKVLVAVGRLVGVKGFDVLVDACRQLKDRHIPIACYVLGGGPLQAALQQQIVANGLADVVRLCGSQSQQQLCQWYRAADLTVLSSHSEGVPNVLLESIACGGSFVATDVGGVSEIFDPNLDRLVRPGDAAALADAVESRLAHPEVGGSRRFEPWSWEQSANQLIGVIESCFSSGAQATRLHASDPRNVSETSQAATLSLRK